MIEEIKIKNEPLPEIQVEEIKLSLVEEIKLKALDIELAEQEPIILKDEVLTFPLIERIELPKL